MATSLVGYNVSDLALALETMELSVEPGKWAKIQFCTESPPTQEMLDEIYYGILATGHVITPLIYQEIKGIPTTSFNIQRTLPYDLYMWALLIPLIIPLATLGLITFGVDNIQNISSALVPILLVAGGIVVITVALLSKPATKYIERGGKIPYLPATKPKFGGEDAEHYLKRLDASIKNLWNKSCDYDQIPRDSKFVNFSKENPYQFDYNQEVAEKQKWLRIIKAGGGLQHRYKPPDSMSSLYLPSTFPKTPSGEEDAAEVLQYLPSTMEDYDETLANRKLVKVQVKGKAGLSWANADKVAGRTDITIIEPPEYKTFEELFGFSLLRLKELMNKVTLNELDGIVSHLSGYGSTLDVGHYPIYSRDQSKKDNMEYLFVWVFKHPAWKASKMIMEALEAQVKEKEAYPISGPVAGTHYIKWSTFTQIPSFPTISRAVAFPHDYKRKCNPITKDGYVSVDALYNLSAWANWKSSSLGAQEKAVADQIHTLRLGELFKLNHGRRMDQPALFPVNMLPLQASIKGPFFSDWFNLTPPLTLEEGEIIYDLYMTTKERKDADDEAKLLREEGEKVIVKPWKGGYLLYWVNPSKPQKPIPLSIKGHDEGGDYEDFGDYKEYKDHVVFKMYCQRCAKEVFPSDFTIENALRNYMIGGLCQQCQLDEQAGKNIPEGITKELRDMGFRPNTWIPSVVKSAYFVLETKPHPEGGFRVLVAEESQPGYLVTSLKAGGTIEEAEAYCDDLNKSMGLTLEEARHMVYSSIKAQGERPKKDKRSKMTLWDRAMYLLQKKGIRRKATSEEIARISSWMSREEKPFEEAVKRQVMKDLYTYPIFDAIAMWVEGSNSALASFDPRIYNIAETIIERVEDPSLVVKPWHEAPLEELEEMQRKDDEAFEKGEYAEGWKVGDYAIYPDFSIRSMNMVQVLPWPSEDDVIRKSVSSSGKDVRIHYSSEHSKRDSVYVKVVDDSLHNWDVSSGREVYYAVGTTHYIGATNLERNVWDILNREKRSTYPDMMADWIRRLKAHPGWKALEHYGLAKPPPIPQDYQAMLQYSSGLQYLPETKLDPYEYAREVLEGNIFGADDIKKYSGESGTNPMDIPDEVWNHVYNQMGGKFRKLGLHYIVSDAEPVPGGYIEKLLSQLTVAEIIEIADSLQDEPDLELIPYYQKKKSNKVKNIAYLIKWMGERPNEPATQMLMDKLEVKVKEKYPDYVMLPATKMRFVEITDRGGTLLNAGTIASYERVEKENQMAIAQGLKPALFRWIPIGWTMDEEGGQYHPGSSWTPQTEDNQVNEGLKQSIREEEQAVVAYKERGETAAIAGDQETANLYEHTGGDEEQHMNEFKKRLAESVGKPKYIPDSQEYMAQTIEESGYREKLNHAFMAAIARVKGK